MCARRVMLYQLIFVRWLDNYVQRYALNNRRTEDCIVQITYASV